MGDVARLMIIGGLLLLAGGVLLLLAQRFLPWLGNLPGDIRYETGNVRIFFPLGTMILLSIVSTILLNVLIRIFRR